MWCIIIIAAHEYHNLLDELKSIIPVLMLHCCIQLENQ